MTFPEFDTFFEGLIDECREMRDTKGKEYAHSESRFANFDRASERLGIGRDMVANVYLHKHLDAIDSYILCKESYSGENIRGRIKDAMVYLSLIAGMIDESMDKASLPRDLCFVCHKDILSTELYHAIRDANSGNDLNRIHAACYLKEPADLAQLRTSQEQALNSMPNLCNDYVATCFYCLKPITKIENYTRLIGHLGYAHIHCWKVEWEKKEKVILPPDRNKAE